MIFVIVAVIVALGIGAYTLSQNASTSDAIIKNYKNSVLRNEAMTEKTDVKMNDSRYVEYTKVVLDNASSNRRVLFFYASWCPTCRPTDVNLRENTDKIPEDVTIVRVNYNDPETDQEEKDLTKKYGITYQHTFVQIDSTGKEITKWNGGQINELLSNIK